MTRVDVERKEKLSIGVYKERKRERERERDGERIRERQSGRLILNVSSHFALHLTGPSSLLHLSYPLLLSHQRIQHALNTPTTPTAI